MENKFETWSIAEIRQGYRYDAARRAYCCGTCGAEFGEDEIFPFAGDGPCRYYRAERAAALHVSAAHGDRLEQLLQSESKYVSLTENQRKLLQLFGQGLADAEIAAQLKLSPSTVRHQRYLFREKAKQARVYLAMYELAEESARHEEFLPPHRNAKMVDERYLMTASERDKVLECEFESLSPLRLKRFPGKEKKKLAILTRIAQEFTPGRHYTEKQVNEILKAIFDDYVTLRRYLIEYGFMERTRDCSDYWRTEE